jgi:enamine deaminase RidA (YjgF/YER057c/UK114 family)
MTRRLIASGSTFETEVAYSRAVVDGEWIFVAGTTGFDYSTMSISADVVEQTEQAFRNIDAALRQAGSALADVVRVTYILPDAKEFPSVLADSAQILRQRSPCGNHDQRRPRR